MSSPFDLRKKRRNAALSEKDFHALKASSFQSKTIGLNVLVEQEFSENATAPGANPGRAFPVMLQPIVLLIW
jgi:hypothetical protein